MIMRSSCPKRKPKVVVFSASPRLMGNSEILLKEVLHAVSPDENNIIYLRIAGLNIAPCSSCGYCLKNLTCKIKDDFEKISRLMSAADVLIIASPIYFYGLPAQFKALIDRSQSRWSRKYILKIKSAVARRRPSYTILVAGTRGKKLFDGALLTLKYFYDVWEFCPSSTILIRGVDKKGEIKNHPRALALTRQIVKSTKAICGRHVFMNYDAK